MQLTWAGEVGRGGEGCDSPAVEGTGGGGGGGDGLGEVLLGRMVVLLAEPGAAFWLLLL